MARRASKLLPPNSKAIERATKEATRVVAEYRISGVRGLVLHVLPSATATWYFHYDVAIGKKHHRRKLRLGRLDALPFALARADAERLRPLIRSGRDPAADKLAAHDALTFAELAEARLNTGDPIRASTERDYRHILRKDIDPIIGSIPAGGVSREDVIRVLDRIAARGAMRRADTARAVISSIYGFGLDRALVSANPAKDLRNRHDYQPRAQILDNEQIRVLWQALTSGQAGISEAVRNILRLILLTGQRRAEIAELSKEELDLKANNPLLVISGGRAKNRNQHRVPLSAQAFEICSYALNASGDGPYLFPGPDGRPTRPRSVSKAMERVRAQLGFNEITVHDLRRTVGSMMTKYGVPRDVRERVLNHGGKRTASVTESVYSWYDYDAEKRAALDLWADALEAIVAGRNSRIESFAYRLAKLKGTKRISVM